MIGRSRRRAAAGALVIAASTAFGGPTAAAEADVVVVTSIFPLAALVRELAPGAKTVALLTPGANPHTFEPTPSQVRAANGADVLVRIGLGFDDWALSVFEGARNAPRVVLASDGLDLLPLTDHEAHHDEAWDPHFWIDPIAASVIVGRLADTLASVDPPGAQQYRQRASKFAGRLRALDAELRRRLEPLRGAAFVGTHAAWAYFARRYELRQLAVLERSPGRPAGPRYLIAVAEKARREDARAVFAEVQLSRGEADIIAEAAGIPVLLLDPLGGEGLEGRDGYETLLRWNVERIVAALDNRPRR